jgi:hypothetical protein
MKKNKNKTSACKFYWRRMNALILTFDKSSFWASAPEGAEALCPHHLDILPARDQKPVGF